MNIAIIPARRGSKRIKNKNIKEFFGKPIIAYSIQSAIQSNIFDKIYVSTDDKEIAAIAKNFGAEVPFLRAAELSDDYTTTTKVISNFIKKLKNEKIVSEFICCIYPAAPLIKADKITEAYKKISKENWSFVFSAAQSKFQVLRSFEKDKMNSLKMHFPENFNTRSQDLKKSYFDAAQFYWGKKDAWLEEKNIFDKNSTIVEIPPLEAIDIDTEEDWKSAEIMYNLLQNEKK